MSVTVDASAAKAKFGQCLEAALTDSVIIRKSKREVAVMLSIQEYERLHAMEDQLWILKAEIAAQEGFLTAQESNDFLKSILEKSQ